MLSLYVHIPFCSSKCAYCSFNSMPVDFSDTLIDRYIAALKQEIDRYADELTDKEIKTLYIGGGTPSKIGVNRIIDIIDYLKEKFNFEHIAELSIELNPNPMDEVLNFVDTINKRYKDFPRVRFSFGIQSLDDEVLQRTGRAYNFTQIAEFLRQLMKYKQENTVFNFDFIAFGKFQVSKNGFKQLRHEFKRNFLNDFLNSGLADSISLYTLENIKDKPCPKQYFGTDEEIMEEFQILKTYIEDAGYQRYEISNFAHAGKASIHNMAYRHREPYLGLGLSAASLLHEKRRTNTGDIKKYIEGERVDEKEIQTLNESDILIEDFFLRLRTRDGIADVSKYTSILVPNYESLIVSYQDEMLVNFDGKKLQLTDTGMNVYNSIVTDLLQKL